MNKKGFTLIELLAVIVVLSIVMVLATSTVLPYLKNIRKQSFITEINSFRKAAENATNLIATGIIKSNNYTKTSEGYCFTINDLKALGMYKKNDDNYNGMVRAIKNGNDFTYQVGFKNNEYYISFTEGEIKVRDIKEVNENFDIKYTCELTDDAYAILTPNGDKEDGKDLYNLTFLRSKTDINVGDIYNENTIFEVYKNIEDEIWTTDDDLNFNIGWSEYHSQIRSVVFEDEIIPKSTVGWFANMNISENINLSYLNSSKITNMSYMFYSSKINGIVGTSSWDTSNVKKATFMFAGTTINSSLDLNNWNISNAIGIEYMFLAATINGNLYLNNWDISSAQKTVNIFYRTSVNGNLDLNYLNASNVTDMSSMFYELNISGNLNLNNWDTRYVTNMKSMFYNATIDGNLKISNWDTSNVEDMSYMFANVIGFDDLDLSSWNVSNVTNMSYMFYISDDRVSNLGNDDLEIVSNLSSIKTDLSKWDVSKVTNMSYMFTTIIIKDIGDISGWNTSNVIDMSYMFNIVILENKIDLSGWNVSKVTKYDNFASVAKLEGNIYVQDKEAITPPEWNK